MNSHSEEAYEVIIDYYTYCSTFVIATNAKKTGKDVSRNQRNHTYMGMVNY